jgi:D-alanyl-D-alanine carboxypeptidase
VHGLSIPGLRRGLGIILILLFASACASPVSTLPSARSAAESATLVPTIPITSAPVAPATSTPNSPSPLPAATADVDVQPAAVIASPVPSSTPEPAPAEAAPFDSALAGELQQILDATVADGTIPGAVLAVHIPGHTPWSGASGLADRRQRLPMEPSTRVRIASISKIFTAVVVMQLVEEGAIDLDAPMTTWLPDLVPNGEQITVRNLLNHTSGLYDFVEDRRFISHGYQKPDRMWEPQELVAYAVKHRPAFAPGAEGAFDYSSTNYVILGMIVERVTGNSLAHEMKQRIFEPLRLENTFFAPHDAVQGQQAHGYMHQTDQTDISLSIVFATANLVSTASDTQRFGQALLDGELLRPATRALMYQFVNGHGQYNMPDLAYGEGIMRNRLPVGPGPDGRPRPAEASLVVGHIGGFGGFRSALWAAPESGITVALAMNQAATDPNILATRVFDTILRHQGR